MVFSRRIRTKGGEQVSEQRAITEEALKQIGFKQTSGRVWQGQEKHRILSLPRSASEFGLSIEVCENDIMKDGTWFCWLVLDEPYRFLPLRHLRYLEELADLYLGIVGERLELPKPPRRKCPEGLNCGPCDKCLSHLKPKDTPCYHQCKAHQKYN